ncbi:GPI ethanolamine phosphate transferase 1 [Dacryopinax primogenitus]|uniref:GPI ethanolamine phosphate transferase 1 n=1 Tax=Dacryopinax primogenitus (strain DJM 731) TaxID=1858805 RepID=M5FTX0_DACPD|nr:GPI ethanolamine phosphate transferase 1 [Dacryopinax primogenitus]EJU01116.1 GPI ethanolamine phosphate transferase 1 [Dacryopinax primogenitus]
MSAATSTTAPTRVKVKGASTTSPVPLLLLGLLFHLAYIPSVLDCYFTSPVVHGMSHHSLPPSIPVPASRLVLIVADGLRADSLFKFHAFPNVPDSPDVVAPYLRRVAAERGAFGVSHTRVPTESRPGHVAMIAGMYEDVSAVTTGWTTNPVTFDSVLNQSSTTFSFGSPDILPMFAHGAVPGRVRTWMYREDEEDFTKDAKALDVWVLDRFRELLANATRDAKLDEEMRAERTVFFLHLLGLDTTGHSYRPHSKEYMQNIQLVDNIVEQVESLISSFYKDDRTAYVFNADHGMSNIGNHGDGHPDNTRTPLIAWGSGIRGPLLDEEKATHDAFSLHWGAPLTELVRHDVEQADIASLMAVLIGAEWPVNGVGVLPECKEWTRRGWLDFGPGEQGEKGMAAACITNARVVLEQYRVKHDLKRSRTALYSPFSQLQESNNTIPPGTSQLAALSALYDSGNYHAARHRSAELISLSLQGLRYLQTYDWLFLRVVVTFGYLGWSAMSALQVLRMSVFPDAPTLSDTITDLCTEMAAVLLAGLLVIQQSRWTYWIYVAFPIYFWKNVLFDLPVAGAAWRRLSSGQGSGMAVVGIILRSLMVLVAIGCMVAGYTNRHVWSLGFGVLGCLWPLSALSSKWLTNQRTKLLVAAWVGICGIDAAFGMLPVEKHEDLTVLMITGAAYLAIGLAAIAYLWRDPRAWVFDMSDTYPLVVIVALQTSFIAVATYATYGAVVSLQAREGLPVHFQMLGWTALLLSSASPFVLPMSDHRSSSRLLTYFLAFCPAFLILSISWEGLFYLAFCATLFLWIELESCLAPPLEENMKASNGLMRVLRVDDIRIALFFFFFINIAFFGTGNVASLSNFYLEPVYRLIPVFKPFLMAVLLASTFLYKVFLPYTIFAACLAMLNKRLHLPPFSIYLVALPLTDGMTLAMFYNVRDEGSWLEIGQTLSHFIITSLLLVWNAGICVVGEWLMSGTADGLMERKRTPSPAIGKEVKLD